MDRFRGLQRCGAGFLPFFALLVPYAACAQSTTALSIEPEPFNQNQATMSRAVRNVCPELRKIVVVPGAATGDEKELFRTCNMMIRGTYEVATSNTPLQELTTEEANASTRNAVTVGTLHRSSITSRLLAVRSAGGGIPMASLSGPVDAAIGSVGGASGDSGSALDGGRLGFYAQGYIGSGDKQRTLFEDAYDIDTDGFVVGADYQFTANLVAGLALGVGRSDSDFTKDSAGDDIGGQFDSDGVTGSIYGSWYGDRGYLDLIFSYGSIDYDSEREIDYKVTAPVISPIGDVTFEPVQDVNAIATGTTSGNTNSFGIGAGYDFGNGPWRFGPLAAMNYFRVNVDGFTETDAGALNLRLNSQKAESLQLQAGVNLAYTMSLSHGVLVPYGNVVWVSEQKNLQNSFLVRYASDPCTSTAAGNLRGCSVFSVAGDKPDSSFMNWNVGLSGVFANGLSAFLNYGAVSQLDTISYGEFTLGVRYQMR